MGIKMDKTQGMALSNLSRLTKTLDRVGLVLYAEDGRVYTARRDEYRAIIESNEGITGREAFLRCKTVRPLESMSMIMVKPHSRAAARIL